jgi:hypothetical protein
VAAAVLLVLSMAVWLAVPTALAVRRLERTDI